MARWTIRIFIVVATLMAAGVSTDANAVTETYADKARFLTLTGGRQLNDPYPSGPSSATMFDSRSVYFTTPSGSSLNFTEWTSEFPGNDLALNGVENFNADISAPVSSIGFDVIEDGANSIFNVKLLRDGTEITTVHLNTSSTTRFFGVWSDTSFDRIEVRETSGDNTNEFFGAFYGGSGRNRDTSSNTAALICQFPLLAAYSITLGASLTAPPPLGTAFGLLAHSANIGLKFCKPWAIAPGDIITYADDPFNSNPDSPGACTKTFKHERVHSGFTNLLGIPVEYDYDWGELGTPSVIHQNTDVEVYMLRGLLPPFTDRLDSSALLEDELAAGGIYSDCDGVKEVSSTGHLCPFSKGREITFGVGRGGVGYRFDVNMGILDLVFIPIPGFPQGTKNKALLDFALNVAAEVILTAVDLKLLGGWRFGNFVDRSQQVIVYDVHAPTISKASGDFNNDGVVNGADLAFIDNVVIEADEVGGVSTQRFQNVLRSMYQVSDNCARSAGLGPTYPNEDLRVFWPVSTTGNDNSFTITWEASDNGPNPATGLPNRASITQNVSVVDTRPPVIQPPPDIVELTSENMVTLDLGQPLVFDLVDLNPLITNDASFPLSPGLHTVTWTATDASGNSAMARQSVNIKNNNIDPDAVALTGGNRRNAISFEPVEIRLEGNDVDGDPLNFFIEDYPENGFFVAPLYPFFIEDYRLEANLTDQEVEDICRSTGNQNFFHLEEIRTPEYFSVLDDGTTYVMDNGYVDCPLTSSLLPPKFNLRIAVFDAEGTFIAAKEQGSNNPPDDFYIDTRTDLVYLTTGSISNGLVSMFDADLNLIQNYNLFSLRDSNGVSRDIPFATSAVFDSQGVFYVLTERGDVHALRAEMDPGNSSIRPEYLGLVLQTSNSGTNFDMAIDTEDNLYVSMGNRVYKISASTLDENGFVPGSLVGWVGRCTADLAPGDQAVCDVANQRSLGYACTDQTCSGGGSTGSQPGQFSDARGIAIDLNNTLYVTDFQNFRIQRFTPDGFFSGQAESACEGNCFVLGDFGRPNDIAVNSTHFFIIDPATSLLHISQTSPFLEMGNDYALVRYQSKNDFACALSADCVDTFTFSVSDGVRDPDTRQMIRSAPALVQVEVARNFRAPFATPGISATVQEEVPTPVLIDGSDPDPLDALTFNISRQPANGSVSLSGNIATYTSDLNYVGEDSFEFTVSDGVATSAAETVTVRVTDVNDPAIITLASPITVARGFEVRLEGQIDDPDPEDQHLLEIRWNDGSPNEPEGEITLMDAMMGNSPGPLLMQNPTGVGTIMATHIFDSAGAVNVDICATDRVDTSSGDKVPTADSIESCATINVDVQDMVDITTTVDRPAALIKGQSSNYFVTISNRMPDSGAGVTATGLELTIDIDPVLITSSPAGCRLSGSRITCSLDSLGPGASQNLTIPIIVPGDPGAIASVDSEFNVTVDQPDASGINRLLLSTPLVNDADFIIGGAGSDELVDDQDFGLGDGICAGGTTGACNLRAAVMEGNANFGGTTRISLGNQVFTLTATDPVSPTSGYGDLDVREHLIITGNGPDLTFINAGGIDRAFDVEPGAILELGGLSVSGGLPSEDIDGGAIRVQPGGQLILRNVRLFGNDTPGAGGAIYNFNASADSLIIENSTISANTASSGAGIVTAGGSQLTNVTLSANRTTGGGDGGGIAFIGGSHQLTNVTLTANAAEAGGGLAVSDGASVVITNTLISGNEANSGSECSVTGATLSSDGGNLIQSVSGCSLAVQSSDITGLDGGLLELADNGGNTPTHGLASNSVARDKGIDANCPAKDQRGEPRPADGIGNGQSRCDIGAFEADAVGFMESIFASSFE